MRKVHFIAVLFLVLIMVSCVQSQKPKIEWASIPAGTFIMGSPAGELTRSEDEAQYEVTLSAFKMSKYVIT